MPNKELHVVMLEDDSDDRYLTEEVLDHLQYKIKIDFYSGSQDLYAALRGTKPNLILVDFNSAPDNGVRILQGLKNSSELRHIPVVILSDSELLQHRDEAYAEGASGYVIKPRSFEQTQKTIKLFFSYWLEVAAC